METIWFWLVAFMLIAYVVLDGFDLGAGILHLTLARTEDERLIVLRTIGPVWDGNEVWLIVAAGATFAAFPGWYASLFSAAYLPMLLVLRTTTFIGVCVEFVAAVAWLAELFPEPKRREAVIGYTQAFGSMGGLMVAGAYYLVVTYADSLPLVRGTHDAWRYTLMSGIVPAIPLIVIRPFLPESPAWREKKAAGTLKRPSFAELFRPEFRRTTIVTTIMMACAYGAAFGAIQQMPGIVPGTPEVATLTPARPLPAPSTTARRSRLRSCWGWANAPSRSRSTT